MLLCSPLRSVLYSSDGQVYNCRATRCVFQTFSLHTPRSPSFILSQSVHVAPRVVLPSKVLSSLFCVLGVFRLCALLTFLQPFLPSHITTSIVAKLIVLSTPSCIQYAYAYCMAFSSGIIFNNVN